MDRNRLLRFKHEYPGLEDLWHTAHDLIMMEQRPLFGGAIACRIPEHWQDVSNVRQVPDHQECWRDVSVPNGAAFVVEILDAQASVPHKEAARYFFDDLAEANGGNLAHTTFYALEPWHVALPNTWSNTQHWKLPTGLPNDAVVCAGAGTQVVANSTARLFAVQNDPSATGTTFTGTNYHNLPPEIGTVAIHLAVLRLPQQATDVLVTLSTPLNGGGDHSNAPTNILLEEQVALFGSILASIQIRDWSLFG
jgi:Ran-interacting Mog1 protein